MNILRALCMKEPSQCGEAKQASSKSEEFRVYRSYWIFLDFRLAPSWKSPTSGTTANSPSDHPFRESTSVDTRGCCQNVHFAYITSSLTASDLAIKSPLLVVAAVFPRRCHYRNHPESTCPAFFFSSYPHISARWKLVTSP